MAPLLAATAGGAPRPPSCPQSQELPEPLTGRGRQCSTDLARLWIQINRVLKFHHIHDTIRTFNRRLAHGLTEPLFVFSGVASVLCFSSKEKRLRLSETREKIPPGKRLMICFKSTRKGAGEGHK